MDGGLLLYRRRETPQETAVTEPTAAPASLDFDDELAQFDAALETTDSDDPTDSAHVAVVADPFGGRRHLLDAVATRLGDTAERVDLAVEDAGDFLADTTAEVVLADDCHRLFRRRVGGFDRLDRFLDELTAFDGLVVTSWNRFAWEYLDAVRSVSRSFPTLVRVSALSKPEMQTYLTAEFGEPLPTFVDVPSDHRDTLVTTSERSVTVWRDRTVTVPVPTLSREYIRHRLGRDGDSLEDRVFERLTRLSDGNPGVARAIWRRTVDEGTLRLADLTNDVDSLDLEYDVGYVLYLVLTSEEVDRATLVELVGDSLLDRQLRELADAGVVTIDGSHVSLDPTGLQVVVDYLRRRRILW